MKILEMLIWLIAFLTIPNIELGLEFKVPINSLKPLSNQ